MERLTVDFSDFDDKHRFFDHSFLLNSLLSILTLKNYSLLIINYSLLFPPYFCSAFLERLLAWHSHSSRMTGGSVNIYA
jgi:hypothetical protein